MQSNLGRLCTFLRFSIEHSIGVIKNKFAIFRHLPWNFIDVAGLLLHHSIACINQFEFGKFKSSMDRIVLYTYLKINLNKYLTKHPINEKFFKLCMLQVSSKTNNFIKINNQQQFISLYGIENMLNFYVDNSDLVVKCCGKFAVYKAEQYVWNSRKSICIYAGINEFQNIIIVTNIYKRFQVIVKKPKISTVMFAINGNPPTNIPNENNIIFSTHLLQLQAICNNILGLRSLNWCSHIAAGAKLLQHIIDGNSMENLPDPTPKITKLYSNVVNIGPWISQKNKLEPQEKEQLLEQIINNNQWLNEPQNMGYNAEVDDWLPEEEKDKYLL